jgi:uncharacterized membrane protein
MNAKKERCLDFLGDYDFEIKHIQGKKNRVADALSRKLNAIFNNNVQYDLKQKIVAVEGKYEKYRKVLEKCQNNQLTKE